MKATEKYCYAPSRLGYTCFPRSLPWYWTHVHTYISTNHQSFSYTHINNQPTNHSQLYKINYLSISHETSHHNEWTETGFWKQTNLLSKQKQKYFYEVSNVTQSRVKTEMVATRYLKQKQNLLKNVDYNRKSYPMLTKKKKKRQSNTFHKTFLLHILSPSKCQILKRKKKHFIKFIINTQNSPWCFLLDTLYYKKDVIIIPHFHRHIR